MRLFETRNQVYRPPWIACRKANVGNSANNAEGNGVFTRIHDRCTSIDVDMKGII